MKSLALRTRLMMLFFGLWIGLFGANLFQGLSAHHNFTKLDAALEDLSAEKVEKLSQLSEMRSSLIKASLTLRDILLASSAEKREDYAQRRGVFVSELVQATEKYKALISPEEQESFQDLMQKIGVLAQLIPKFDQVWKNQGSGPLSESVLYMGHQMINETLVPARNDVENKVRALFNENRDLMASIQTEAKAADAQAKKSIVWILSLVAIFSVVYGAVVFKSLRKLSATVEGITHRLTSTTAVVKRSATQSHRFSSTLAQNSELQNSALNSTANTLEQLGGLVTKSANNSKDSITTAQQSSASALNGKQAMENVIAAIEDIHQSNNSISEQVDSSNREIAKIVDVISDIETKTSVINDIVFKTKLLSFNASVEAARAGQHGMGFAVVAEEIGKLAQVSGEAAKEISDMLSEGIERVRTTVDTSQKSISAMVLNAKNKIDAGTKMAKDCEETLSTIVEQAQQTHHLMQEVSTAAAEQSNEVSNIRESMEQLGGLSATTVSTAREVANVSHSLSAEASELEQSVTELTKIVRGSDSVATGQPNELDFSQSHESSTHAKTIHFPRGNKDAQSEEPVARRQRA